MTRSWIAFLLGLSLSTASFADETPYIPVGPGKLKKTVFAFPEVQTPGATLLLERRPLTQTLQQTFTQDLLFMDQYQFLAPTTFIEKPNDAGLTADKFKMTDWSSIGTDFLLKTSLTMEAKNIAVEAYLYEVSTKRQLLAKRYLAAAQDAKTLGHQLANDVIEKLTGLPGIFQTKIAMSCDRNGKKEIYIMNFDGTDVRQITAHHSTAMSPAWNPDGTKIAYSLYNRHAANIKNLDLFEFDFLTSSVRLLSNRKGINSGAAYTTDGKKIALTMSFLGNPEIFLLDPATKQVSPLTKSFGFDVDPAWSPDGRELAFVSNRSGRPMIYRMKADGSGVQRLTFAGVYNATPSWAPTGRKLAFAGWLQEDGHFDIFIMNTDGTKLERLTKQQGNNEDPTFSPDGGFIAYSSNRTGTKNIYVMNVDGTFHKRLTYGLGNCVSPKWSNPPRQ